MGGEPLKPFNDRRVVMQLVNLENKIQVDDNMDDVAHNIHRHAVMADMMTPGWYDGWESIYDNVENQFNTVNDNQHCMKEMVIATDGDMAFIIMHIHLEQLHGGSPRIFAFRQVDTFQKLGERFLCRQAHCMVPIVAASGLRAPGALPLREEWSWPADTLPGPTTTEAAAKEEIWTWFNQRIAAKSADAVMAAIGPREDVIVYSPYQPEEHRGQAEIRAYYEGVFAKVRAISVELIDYHVATNGIMASILCRLNLAVTSLGGEESKLSVRQSHWLRRVGGVWQSMMEMTSFTVDLHSGLPVNAAIDRTG